MSIAEEIEVLEAQVERLGRGVWAPGEALEARDQGIPEIAHFYNSQKDRLLRSYRERVAELL